LVSRRSVAPDGQHQGQKSGHWRLHQNRKYDSHEERAQHKPEDEHHLENTIFVQAGGFFMFLNAKLTTKSLFITIGASMLKRTHWMMAE